MDNIDSLIPLLAATAPAGGTSGTVEGLLVYMVIALGFSFLCSILEAALLSTPPAFVEAQARSGTRAGLLMQHHKQNVEEPITAILTLNTIAHTVGAAGAGAQAVGVFGEQWFGVITAVLTLLILALSEIVPKTLGAVYWKELFAFSAYTIHTLTVVLMPVIWVFNWMTRLLTSGEKPPTVTRSELEMMAQISATEGTIEERESRIFRNLLHLGGVQVFNIMTPRTVMLALPQDMTVSEVMNTKHVMPYSRIPVYHESIDQIVGFVLRHDILKCVAQDNDNVRLREIIRTIHSVPETVTVFKVLDEFMLRKEHIFLVFDEYGGTAGIVTMEDALESLLGTEITDESDLVEDLRQLAEQRYTRQMELLEASIADVPPKPSPNGAGEAADHVPDKNPSEAE